MIDFIKLIEGIGFEKNIFISTPNTLIYEFRNWEIKIIKGTKISWSLQKPLEYDRVSLNGNWDNPINDTTLLNKIFNSEIRNFKLKELGI